MSDEEKAQRIKLVKKELEGVADKIPGIEKITVITEGLESSNADMMLDSTFVSKEALEGYTIHPVHVHVAETFIRPFVEYRLCWDYEEN